MGRRFAALAISPLHGAAPRGRRRVRVRDDPRGVPRPPRALRAPRHDGRLVGVRHARLRDRSRPAVRPGGRHPRERERGRALHVSRAPRPPRARPLLPLARADRCAERRAERPVGGGQRSARPLGTPGGTR